MKFLPSTPNNGAAGKLEEKVDTLVQKVKSRQSKNQERLRRIEENDNKAVEEARKRFQEA